LHRDLRRNCLPKNAFSRYPSAASRRAIFRSQ
jgi:hypothetical protein